jgi:hypothetical protein
MINLMYLVFIAMLMNVSKEVITGFGWCLKHQMKRQN